MTNLFKRAIALCLCLCLALPALAGAEAAPGAQGIRFTLGAEMFPENYPAADQPLMQGLAELVRMMRLEGVFEFDRDSIDLSMDFLLDEAEETRTHLRLYGCESHWGIQSSLLGEQQVYLNLQAALEFAAKAYFHLEIPLQRVFLFLTPYIHKDGFQALSQPWRQVMNAREGSRVIDRDTLLSLAEQLGEISQTDRAFTYWVYAVALESGYDGAILDAMADLPSWWDSFLGEEGLTIKADKAKETWTTGEHTLFSRETKEGWTTLSITVPPSPEGYAVSAFCTFKDHGATLDADLRLAVTQEDATVLDWRVSADGLPKALPLQAPFSLTWDATGEAVPDGVHVKLEGEGDGRSFQLRQVDALTGAVMLALHGTAEQAAPLSALDYTPASISGVELFSVSDASLSELVRGVAQPLLTGLMPLAVHMPVAAAQSLMDLITDTGILEVLTASSGNSETEEDWEEESWDEAEWDEGSEPEYE